MGQRRAGKRLAIVLAAVGLSMVPAPWAGASGPSTPAGDTAAGAADDEFAGLVDIGGGRRLYLECRGSGSPTVVFESGSGDAADIWSYREEGSSETPVLPAVAEFTRVCAYDRPGTALQSGDPSRSDPIDLPRPVSEIVADLHALLDAADVPGTYVLVAHSMGGLLARLYAGTYPDEVAGFVSVDAVHEIYYEAYQELLPPELYMAPGIEIDVVAAAAASDGVDPAAPASDADGGPKAFPRPRTVSEPVRPAAWVTGRSVGACLPGVAGRPGLPRARHPTRDR